MLLANAGFADDLAEMLHTLSLVAHAVALLKKALPKHLDRWLEPAPVRRSRARGALRLDQ
jgi:hypothetical protein